MITIKIIDCPNKDILGKTTFFSNLIEIGSSSGDILLLSKEYLNHLFYLEVIDQELQIIPNPNIDFYLLNGKRSLSQRKLIKGDTVKFNNFSFSIEDFKLTESKNYDEIISHNFENLDEEKPLYQTLITLDKELVDLEDANN